MAAHVEEQEMFVDPPFELEYEDCRNGSCCGDPDDHEKDICLDSTMSFSIKDGNLHSNRKARCDVSNRSLSQCGAVNRLGGPQPHRNALSQYVPDEDQDHYDPDIE